MKKFIYYILLFIVLTNCSSNKSKSRQKLSNLLIGVMNNSATDQHRAFHYHH